jgi:hypothetical protein
MGHYTASTFSHVRIPFDYSALLQLQDRMIERMDRCIPDLDRFNFNLDQYNRATLNSTFELYKSDIWQIFKLFKDLLASLPHVPERQPRQWDVASFVTATAALTLSTYNTVQISKLETAIKTQKQKTDLLADIVHIHEQHLHQLDMMIDDIGNEIAKLKVQAGFHFSVDRAIAQVISDSNKLRAVVAIFERVINSAFDQKLAPGALSVDVLDTIVHHIKDTAAKNKFHSFIHQPSDLYKLETSFIHRRSSKSNSSRSRHRLRRPTNNKIQPSIFRSRRPLCSSTPKQKEGHLSIITQFFSELLILFLYFHLLLYIQLLLCLIHFSTLLFHIFTFRYLSMYSYFHKYKHPRTKGEISHLIF